MTSMYTKSFDDADEVKAPPKAHVSVVKLGDMNASKMILEPGWKWSECIKPTVGGDSCQAGHVGVIIQGQLMCVHVFLGWWQARFHDFNSMTQVASSGCARVHATFYTL